jgi:hypothetical protein
MINLENVTALVANMSDEEKYAVMSVLGFIIRP